VKVLILNSLYAPHIRGGAERSLQMLAEALVADGVEVVVGCTAPAALPAQRHNGVEVIYVHGLNIFWPFDGSERPAVAPLPHCSVNADRTSSTRTTYAAFPSPRGVRSPTPGCPFCTPSATTTCAAPVRSAGRRPALASARVPNACRTRACGVRRRGTSPVSPR